LAADAELDGFVDGAATRLASFGKAVLAAAKAQVNRATLPPDADPRTAYTQFLSSLTRPGIEALLPQFEKLAAEKGLQELELRSGDHLGIARQEIRWTPTPHVSDSLPRSPDVTTCHQPTTSIWSYDRKAYVRNLK
jgi:hypothetical protein